MMQRDENDPLEWPLWARIGGALAVWGGFWLFAWYAMHLAEQFSQGRW